MENKHVFIGREKELETLHNAYSEAKTGKGKLVLIAGNTGLGKSALVKTFFNQIKGDKEVIVGFSECTDMEDQNPYSPIKNVFIELNVLNSNKKITTEKLKEIVNEAGSSWVGMLPFFGGFLSAGITTVQAWRKAFNKDKDKTIIENKDDVFRIFENELRRLAKNKTIIFCVDDLQWADTSSLNVIYELGRRIRNNPFKILVIGTYRPNDIEIGRKKETEEGLVTIPHPFTEKLNEFRNYTKKQIYDEVNPNWLKEIGLKPFTKAEFETFVNSLFPNNNFSQSFYSTIYELTDGDPLFVTEILEQLSINHSIELIDGVYNAKNVHVDKLPKSVSASIAQKVGRLNEALKDVLTYASVSGEIFMVDIIEEIVDINRFKLLKHLKNLDKIHNLVIEEEPINVNGKQFSQYQFSRSLIQKYIYKTLLSSAEKRELHQFISEILLSIYGEEEIKENKYIRDRYLLHKQIGSGLLNSDDYTINTFSENKKGETLPDMSEYIAAAKDALQKAKESYEQFAMDESLGFVDKTLAFLSKIDNDDKEKVSIRMEALLWRNKIFQWQGHYQNAFDTAEEIRKLANSISSEEQLAKANLALGIAQSKLGFNKDALAYFERAIDFYKTTDKYESLWKAYYEAGNTNKDMAADNDAIELYEKALALSDKIADKNIKGRTYLSMGSAYSSKLVEESIVYDYFNKALAIFEVNKNQYWIGMALNKIGNEYRSEMNYPKSKEYLEKALKIARDQNDDVNISNRLNNIALIHESKEEYNLAIDYYNQTLDIDTKLDDKPMIAKSMNNIGNVYVLSGDIEKGMDYLHNSHDIIKSLNNPKELSTSYHTLASAYDAINNKKKAEDYFLKAIAVDTRIDDRATLALHSYFLGHFYFVNDKHDSATKYFLSAMELLEEIGHKLFIAVTNNSLGLIASEEGKYDKAITFFEFALAYYKEVEDKSNQLDVGENLAKAYFDKKTYEEAIEFYKELIELALAEDEKEYLSNFYAKIGNAFFITDQFDEANIYYRKEIDIDTSLYGHESKEVATGYSHLANSFLWGKQFNEAIQYYKTSLELRKKLSGDNSKEIDYSIYDLALAYYYADKDDIAHQHLLTCLEFRKKNYGENSEEYAQVKEFIDKIEAQENGATVAGTAAPDSRKDVESNPVLESDVKIEKEVQELLQNGIQFFEKNDYNEAFDYYSKALESSTLLADNDNAYILKTELNYRLGQVYHYSKNYDAAIKYYIDAYNFCIKMSGDIFIDVGRICIYLGDVYLYKEDYKNAIENHKEALQAYTNAEGHNGIMVGWANYNLGRDYYWNDQFDLSIKHYKEALKIRIANKGDEHEDIASCYMRIGDAYFQTEDKLAAAQNFYNAYTVRKGLYGEDAKETDESKLRLGQAYNFTDLKDKASTYLNASLQFREKTYGVESEEYKYVKEWIDENLN